MFPDLVDDTYATIGLDGPYPPLDLRGGGFQRCGRFKIVHHHVYDGWLHFIAQQYLDGRVLLHLNTASMGC